MRERWVGPFKFSEVLERSIDLSFPKPPESESAYVVTLKAWKRAPSRESVPLYVGGNTGLSKRFRTRVGDLVADMFGFFGSETGHHSGGQSVHAYCERNRVSPLNLFIGWVEGCECHRCLEIELCRSLRPSLNRSAPSRCSRHERRSSSTATSHG